MSLLHSRLVPGLWTSVMLDGSLQDSAAACWKCELTSSQSHTRLHPTPRCPFIAGSIPQLLLLFLLLDVLFKVRHRPHPPFIRITFIRHSSSDGLSALSPGMYVHRNSLARQPK